MRVILRELFSGADGQISSKRVLGAIALLFALVLTVFVLIYEKEAKVLMYPYAAASGLLGIGVFEKRK